MTYHKVGYHKGDKQSGGGGSRGGGGKKGPSGGAHWEKGDLVRDADVIGNDINIKAKTGPRSKFLHKLMGKLKSKS